MTTNDVMNRFLRGQTQEAQEQQPTDVQPEPPRRAPGNAGNGAGSTPVYSRPKFGQNITQKLRRRLWGID